MKYNNTLMNNLFASTKNTVNRLLTLLVLTLTIGVGKILADQTALINNVTLPDVPTGTLDMSSQTFKTPDDDGWIVLQPNADIRNANVTWFTAMAWNTSSQTISDVSSYTAPFYTLNSVAVTTVQQTARTKAIRFTKATDISFLVHSGGSRTVYVSLYSYNTLTETQSLVETKSQGNSWGELLFSGLTHTTTYIAYMYESTNSNGYIAEIAIKKYDASSADVDCGAAATLTPNVLGAYNVDQWSTVSPLTFTATAVNGGELSYQWYQWVDGDSEHGTEATKIEAVGTGAKTNSFTPDVTTATTRHYICIVKEAGCTNEARLNVGTYTVNAATKPCPTQGTVYSASTSATGDISIDGSTNNLELNTTTHKTTVSDGKMYVYNEQSSSKKLITSSGFCMTNNNTYFKIELDCELQEGDVISISVGKDGSNERGVWVSSATSRPGSAPACALTATSSSLTPVTYTVTDDDEYNGKTVLYIYRATSNSTYFNNINITRPTHYSVTYDANGATGGNVPTDANTYAENATFTALGNTGNLVKTGKVFAGWNTQANGLGTPYSVGATVTMGDADMTLYAQWEDPCAGPTITAQNLPGNAGLTMYDTPVEMSVTATPSNGGALSYKWYQNTEGSKLGANVMEAEGTNNQATYYPTTNYAHTHFYWCVVTEAGCSTTTESNLSGIISVAKGRAQGWVIFDGTFDTSFESGDVTFSGATVDYEIDYAATMIDVSGYTNNANTRDYEKAIKVSKTTGATDVNRSLKFTIPEGYKLIQIKIAASGSGNRVIVLSSSIVTSADADDVIDNILSVSSNNISAADYSCDLPAGDYYLCGGFGGDWYIADLQLVLEALPCTAPTINSFAGHDGIVDYGDSFTISVNATANDGNELNYEWWYYMGNTPTEHHKLATTTTNSYTITNDGSFEPTSAVGMYFYYCIVKSLSCSAQTAVSGANTLLALICAAPTEVTVNGAYSYLSGQTITLTATPTGGTGTPSYQWQKYYIADGETDANWHDIDNATSATYTKASCGYGDSGSYRCVVTTGEGCSATSTAYGVHVFSLDGGYGTDPWSQNDITLTSGTTGVATVHLDAGKLYKFKVNSNYGLWYGNGGSDPAWDGWYTLGGFTDWTFGTDGGNMRLYTGPAGDYTFTVNVEHAFDGGGQYVTVSVTYPTVQHPNEGYVYYSNPNGWTEVKAHWWTDGGGDFTAWNDNPAMFTTSICGTTYWYIPKMEGYDRIIFRNSDATAQTEDITVTASNAGQYYDANAWHAFTTNTITFDGNGETSGTMADITGIACGTDAALTANAFVKDGYTFEGWTADVAVTVGGNTIAIGETIADEATLQNITGDINLTAQWEQDCATVDILTATAVASTKNDNMIANGTVGGTAQNYLSSSKKMDKGRYFFVKLANGNLKAGDIIKIDLQNLSDVSGHANIVYLFTGDKDTHTYYATISTPATGVTSYTLPNDFPNNINGIGLYRSTDAEGNTYNANPYINGITITRPNCDALTAPTITLDADNGTLCPGDDATLTATVSPAATVLTSGYSWFKTDGTQLTGTASTLTVNPDAATTYYCVAYTDLYKVQSNNITVSPKSVTITAEDEVERTKTLTLTGSGNGTWSVTNGTGAATLSANSGTTVTLTGTAEGTVTVSFAYDGCTVTKEITVIPKTSDFCENIPTTATGSSHEFSDGTVFYRVNSSGVILSEGTNFASFSSSCASGVNKYSGGQHFALNFPKPVSKFILYSGGSTTNVGSFKHSGNGGTSYSSYGSSDYTFSNTSVSGCLTMTFEATGIGYFPSNELLWIKLGAGRDIYGICILYKETEEFIFENNGDWNTASSWNFGVVPSEVDNVTINAAATVNTTGVQCNNLTMGTGSLTIAGSGLLTVNGVLENSEAEKLVVNIPGGIAAADYDNARATVNFHSIAKRNAAGDYQWQYIGWPFTHLADVHWPFSGSWLMRYDASTEDWVNLRNGDGVDPFVGHALTQAAEKDFSWTGTLNAPVATTYDMEYPEGEQNWNLFANSWLAPIAVEQMTTADFHNAKAEVYLYNTGSYNEWEASSDFGSSEGQYTTITPGSASTEHLVIPPMQGFFVQTEGTGAQLTLNYERLVMGKAANLTQTTALRAPRRSPAGDETEAIDLMPQSYIKICIRGEHYADQMYILMSDNYTDGYDNGADGTKIFGSEAAPQLFAPTEYGNMAILATPEIDGTLLGLRAGTADTDYAMTFYGVEGDLYITDLLTNTETLLLDSMTYNFTADNTADIMARFRLNRSTQHGGTTTDIDEGSAGYKIIVREGKVTIWSQLPTAKLQDIRLYDAAGKLLWIESGANKQESGQALEFTLPQQGVYLLRIGSSTHKVVY